MRVVSGTCKGWIVLLGLCALTGVAVGRGLAGDDWREDYRAMKRDAIGPLQTRFERIVSERPNDPTTQLFVTTVERVDNVVNSVVDCLTAARQTEFRVLLDDITAEEMSASQPPDATASVGGIAAKVYLDHRDFFLGDIATPKTDATNLAVLKEYTAAAFRAGREYIFSREASITGMGTIAKQESVRLQVVLAFLETRDHDWSQDHITRWPQAIKSPQAMRVIERFALEVQRPLTALECTRFREKKPSSNRKACEYMFAQAAILAEDGILPGSLQCLSMGIASADGAQRLDMAVDTCLRVAAAYSEVIGKPEFAALAVKRAMAVHPTSRAYGKAAFLRLKYLYDAGKVKAICDEAPKVMNDPRCVGYRPQIMYLSWAAHQHMNRTAIANRLGKEFIEKYPDNMLCAHMYVALAVAASVSQDYEEAGRLLEIVEFRYPHSQMIPECKRIREQLNKSFAKNTH